jgi:hypothetical protein
MNWHDTALVRMVITDLAEKHSWTYAEALDKFYNSDTCEALSDVETGMFTFAPREIIELFEEEVGAVK